MTFLPPTLPDSTRRWLLAPLVLAAAWSAVGEEPAPTPQAVVVEQREIKSVYADDLTAFPILSIPVDEHGAPVVQTLRLNQPGKTHSDARVSGFRFRVDRSQAAERQGATDKTKLDLFWFFVMPYGVESWYIVPVKGEMNGFESYCPLLESAFKNRYELLPVTKQFVVIQRLAAESLKEGEEYIIWFHCSDHADAPIEMSLALGYRQDGRSFKKWENLTSLAEFLGLVPAAKKVGYRWRAF